MTDLKMVVTAATASDVWMLVSCHTGVGAAAAADAVAEAGPVQVMMSVEDSSHNKGNNNNNNLEQSFKNSELIQKAGGHLFK